MKGFYTFSISTMIFFIIGFTLVSFERDCQHIYTAVVEKDIKINPVRDYILLDSMVVRPTGKHEGQQLVCVKCFHLTKQILDYGK